MFMRYVYAFIYQPVYAHVGVHPPIPVDPAYLCRTAYTPMALPVSWPYRVGSGEANYMYILVAWGAYTNLEIYMLFGRAK